MRVAIDVGSVRVGVARSDPQGVLAVPEATLRRDEALIPELVRLCIEQDAAVVYVGLPLTLAGEHGAAASDAESVASALASALTSELASALTSELTSELASGATVPVHLIDERLTTVSAQQAMRDAGRSSRESRAVIDQAAAVAILEHALATERASGNLAGRAVTV